MILTEAVEIINKMGAAMKFALGNLQEQKFQMGTDVNITLDYHQEQKFQKILKSGRRVNFKELKSYKEAIGLLIERGRTDLLERCRKIYELACKTELLLKKVISNRMKIGKTEAKGFVLAIHIKAYWEAVVLPILQTDAENVASPTLQTKAEAHHRGRPKDVNISWLVNNPDGHLEVLHDLADGKRGVKFFRVIKAAFLKGWFEMPSCEALKKEFGDIGARSGYYDYMGNKYNEKELEQLGATLISRCQNL